MITRGYVAPSNASGGALPTPDQEGQVLFSRDGTSFDKELPLTELSAGWLVNDDGILLVVG